MTCTSSRLLAIFILISTETASATYLVDKEVPGYGDNLEFDTLAANASDPMIYDSELYVVQWPSVKAGQRLSCFVNRCTPEIKSGYAFIQGVVNNGTGITTSPTEGVFYDSNLGCPPDMIFTADKDGIFYSAFYCQNGCQNMTVSCSNADDFTFAATVTKRVKDLWNGDWRHLFPSEEKGAETHQLLSNVEENAASFHGVESVANVDPILLQELEGKPRLLVDRLLAEDEEEEQEEEADAMKPAPFSFSVDSPFTCYESIGGFSTPADVDGNDENELSQNQMFVSEWPSVPAGTTLHCTITCDTNTSMAFAQAIHAPTENVSKFLFEDRTVGTLQKNTNGCPMKLDLRAETDGPLYVAVFCKDGCKNGLITCESHGNGCDFVTSRVKAIWSQGWSALTGRSKGEGPTRRRLRHGVKDIWKDYYM